MGMIAMDTSADSTAPGGRVTKQEEDTGSATGAGAGAGAGAPRQDEYGAQGGWDTRFGHGWEAQGGYGRY